MNEKKLQGWAALPKEKHREFSSRGGKVARDMGVAHRWTQEEAKVAARLGGLKTQENRRKKKEQEENERLNNLSPSDFANEMSEKYNVNKNDVLEILIGE